MAICLKRVRGLKRVRVADAAWIWTEPHSMRLKVRLTIQKEVAPGAILQKPLDCEFVVRNQQCTDCRQQFENFAWTAAVQVRQRVSHKRTFFYLEQAILKKNAQAAAVKIEQFRDGLDFFFRQRNDAVRFVQFLKDCVPCRVKETKKLVSADPKSNLFNHQYTSLVTLAEACKEDLVVVDSRTASRLGSLPRLLLVRSVNAVVRLVDPQTGRIAELHTEGYFKAPPSVCFGVLCSSHRRLAGRRARRRWSMACRSPAPRRRGATTLHQHAIAAPHDKSARAKVTRRPK